MAVLRVLNTLGDTRVSWDRARVQAGDPEALAAVREAQRIFDEARARGAQAFRVRVGQPAERLERFDPLAEQVVLIPPVVGG